MFLRGSKYIKGREGRSKSNDIAASPTIYNLLKNQGRGGPGRKAIEIPGRREGGERMNSKGIIVIVVVVLLLGGGAFLLSMNKSTSSQNTTTNQTPATPTPANHFVTKGKVDTVPANVEQIAVSTSNFKFTPETISVKKGDKVEITVKNDEGTHDFVIDEFNVHSKLLSAGQSDTVTFTADKAGTFEFYCSVDHHRQMGMKGTLTVE